MEIKELEALLSVSRSNIRFYEKKGLLEPHREKNKYRNYSEADIAMLKKIIVLRKLGFSVEEISAMQNGELLLPDAVKENITRLEGEIERLKGALETTKVLSAEQASFEEMDEERYWNDVTQAENKGKGFFDICRDYVLFEADVYDIMWKNVFFHDFKKSRKKYGMLKACGILLLICFVRGLSKMFIWHESFWDGFLYPAELFLLSSFLLLPIYILNKKAPKVGNVVSKILLAAAVAFLSLIILFVIGLVIYAFIRGDFA